MLRSTSGCCLLVSLLVALLLQRLADGGEALLGGLFPGLLVVDGLNRGPSLGLRRLIGLPTRFAARGGLVRVVGREAELFDAAPGLAQRDHHFLVTPFLAAGLVVHRTLTERRQSLGPLVLREVIGQLLAQVPLQQPRRVAEVGVAEVHARLHDLREGRRLPLLGMRAGVEDVDPRGLARLLEVFEPGIALLQGPLSARDFEHLWQDFAQTPSSLAEQELGDVPGGESQRPRETEVHVRAPFSGGLYRRKVAYEETLGRRVAEATWCLNTLLYPNHLNFWNQRRDRL